MIQKGLSNVKRFLFRSKCARVFEPSLVIYLFSGHLKLLVVKFSNSAYKLVDRLKGDVNGSSAHDGLLY